MAIRTIIKNNPFVTYAAIGVVLLAVGTFLDVQYDERGFRGGLFWTGQLFGLWAWIPGEALHSLFGGMDRDVSYGLTLVIGIAMCAGLDQLWRTWLRRRARKRQQT